MTKPDKNNRIRLIDVAKLVGTSPGTVSVVLNKRKSNIRVSEKTRQRIFDAAKELGFCPDPIAQSLRMKRTATIGVVVNGLEANADALMHMERISSSAGYEVLLALSRWEASREDDEIQRLINRRVDGLLLLSPAINASRREMLESVISKGIPIVGIGPMIMDGIDQVDWGRSQAFEQLTEDLLKRGCRRLAFLGWQHTPGVEERLVGIRMAANHFEDVQLQVVGCPHGLELHHHTSEDAAMLLDEAYGDDWPDAVLCQNDELALAVMQRARLKGIRLPNELAIVGGDNRSFSRMLDTPLTTIKIDKQQMVKVAMKRLIDCIELKQSKDESTPKPQRVIVPAEVMIRQSSDFAGVKSF